MVGTDQLNLWTAASDGDLDRVKTLIEDQGMSADAKDDNGYTAIHAAASWAHPSLLRYLLSKGGNINITDNDGDTPLFTVESLDMCKLVLELGADPNVKNEAGQTAAQSLLEDHPEISEFLATLTGETLPARDPSAINDNPAEQGQGDRSSMTAEQQAEAAALALQNVPPPEDVLSLDPMSRAAAIETNNRAGQLLARVQAILEETDRTGEDPEPRIREIVNEAVQSTMAAGRELARAEIQRDGEEESSSAAQAAAAETDQGGEKRPRTDADTAGR